MAITIFSNLIRKYFPLQSSDATSFYSITMVTAERVGVERCKDFKVCPRDLRGWGEPFFHKDLKRGALIFSQDLFYILPLNYMYFTRMFLFLDTVDNA